MRPGAVLYQIDPSLFLDTDGDGWGDLKGVTRRLDHVRDLGADSVWLTPFYVSPRRDAGYDVADHLSVDPRLGTLDDMEELLASAKALDIEVMVELVMQHTSDRHRWFRQARSSRDSRYRDWYLWADEPPDDGRQPIFPTVEDSVWSWDEQAGQYYRHLFYHHEPDLNLAHPEVRAEVLRTMDFWLDLGVSGFRVDAVPYMIELACRADPTDDGYWFLRQMRDHTRRHGRHVPLMGEADVPVEDYARFVGDDDRLTHVLDFWANNHFFHALASHDASPLRHGLSRYRDMPPEHRAVWSRNHDELDLEQLEPQAREETMRAFAPNPHMQEYGRGIRRRLAPMLGGDLRRNAMAHAVFLSLPGVPIIRYGSEIGMGDDLSRPERWSVRTPMQWNGERNGGFSIAARERLVAPPIEQGFYGYRRVNVAAQRGDRDSLLSRIQRMLRAYGEVGGMGRACRPVDAGQDAVSAMCHQVDAGHVLTMANLAPRRVSCAAPFALDGARPLLDEGGWQSSGHGVVLEPYAYQWWLRQDG